MEGVGRRAFILLGALGSGALGFFACNTYDSSLLEPAPGSAVESRNGIGWWSKEDSRGCFSAGVPSLADRPGPQDAKDVGPVIMAIDSMKVGSLDDNGALDPNAWKDLGFDLDGVCTASDTCESVDPPPSCQVGGSALPRDGKYCRDNTFGRLEYAAALIPELTTKYGLSDDRFNCALCVGHYNFLIRVTGYNGEPNDDRVRIDFYPSPGLEKPLPWDCSKPDWRTHPCFTPDMPWTVEEGATADGRPGPELGDGKMFDDAAYVRDGYIVARLPEDTLFWFPGYKALVVAYPLRLQNAVVTGRIARGADGIWRIGDGMIGGRTLGDDVVKGFRLMGFCDTNDPQNYDLMTTFVRSNLDVLADGRSDSNVPCNAMSVGIGYTAVQARAGKLERVEPLVECKLHASGGDAGADAQPKDAGAD
jgi:hypothetical protein